MGGRKLNDPIEALRFDTADYPAAERFGAWASSITDFTVSPLDAAAPFDARATVYVLGPAIVVASTLPAVRFVRTAEQIRSDGRDHFSLQVVETGGFAAVTDDNRFFVAPSTPCLLDLARPVTVEALAGNSVTVLLDRAFIEEGLASIDHHGLLPAGPLTTVLARLLGDVVGAFPDLDKKSAALIARQIRDLVAMAASTSETGGGQRPQPLRTRIARHVRANAAGPLDPASLCAALGVSRAAMYRALAGEKGLRSLVRNVRLAKAHRMLLHDAGLPVGEIARRCGIGDKAQFSRLFRARYGHSPTDLRTGRHNPAPFVPAASVQHAYRALIDELSVS